MDYGWYGWYGEIVTVGKQHVYVCQGCMLLWTPVVTYPGLVSADVTPSAQSHCVTDSIQCAAPSHKVHIIYVSNENVTCVQGML